MNVFSHPDFDGHERVLFGHDLKSGLKAIIAIHNTNRGPALGGCRMWPYASEAEALKDVLRLSKGMTYKSALANLPLGGGKAVILGDPRQHKTPELLRAMGRFIESANGHYITAEDSGTSVPDLKIMTEETSYVAGVMEKPCADGHLRSGDPSPSTAYGVYRGLMSAVEFRLGRTDLSGLKVAIQGVGNVGFRLARHLHEAGAELWVTDIYDDMVQRCVTELGAKAVSSDEIYGLDVDVFAPCAMGGILNSQTVDQLKAKVVAGAANNQLESPLHGNQLRERGILYAPDYAINSGGIIDVCYERMGNFDPKAVNDHIESIHSTLMEIFTRADSEEQPTHVIADQVARERFSHPEKITQSA